MKTVYDQDYKKYSTGKILTSEIVKFVIDVDKVKAIDYVQGDEGYKRDWTPKRRERIGFLIFNKSFKGTILSFLFTKCLPFCEKNHYMMAVKNILLKSLKNKTLNV